MLSRRRAALVLASAAVALLVPATVAGATSADESPRGQVLAPDLSLLVEGAPALVDPFGAAALDVAAPVSASAFSAPANTDFALSFDSSVDAATRQVVTAAAGLWSAVLEVRVPITVQVTMPSMGPGMLGAAGPTSAFFGYPSFPRADVLYPVALANQMHGRDLDTLQPDIELELSTSVSWDKRIDGSVAPAAQSMLLVAVHELAHGLGHTSWVRPSGLGWAVNYQRDGVTLGFAYDRLVVTPGGTPITSVSEAALGSVITSPLHWSGGRGRTANGGTGPRLYAPGVFEVGSSIGHLDEATFTSGLMTPFLGRGEVHTTVPTLSRAMLADIGWTLSTTTSPTTAPPGGSSPLTTSAQATAFVQAVVEDFLGRAATSAETTRWRDHLLAGGSRDQVTRAFAFSDEWIGVIVDGLYRSTLGRGPDAVGRAHWIQVIRSGRTPADVASYFYASDEYFRRAGGTNLAWVSDLYSEILGRTADAGGLSFWVGRSATVPRPSIAHDFYQSLESRRDRVHGLFDTLLGRAPDADGWSYWAQVLTNGRDVDLAMFLAASDEYFARATRRA